MAYAWTAGVKGPSEVERSEIQKWIQSNRAALDLMEESLRKPKAQWPGRDRLDQQPEMGALSLLIRARLIEADGLADSGQFEKAANSLRGSLRLAQLAIESDAALIHYLLGGSARTLVHGAIQRLAGRAGVPVSVLEGLLKDLPPLDSEPNAYERILRVEFTLRAYPALNLQRLREEWSKPSGGEAAAEQYPDEMQRPFRILADPVLLALHPKPLDAEAELERAIRFHRICRTNVLSPWATRNDGVEDEREDIKDKLLDDIEPLLMAVGGSPLPLNPQMASRLRKAYLRIENPIGRVLQCGYADLPGSDRRVFRYRTEREAVRAILAAAIFERRNGQLPRSLNALVEAHILNSVPRDHLGSAPLSYSPERRIVWSVGEDGVDGGGKDAVESHWAGNDAVWEIPNTK